MNAKRLMAVLIGLCVLPGLAFAGAASPSSAEDVGWEASTATTITPSAQVMDVGQAEPRPEAASPHDLEGPLQCLGGAVVMAPPPAGQTEHYVATTGDDTAGDGSETNPWATIGYALSQAAAGDAINVAAGTYVEAGQLVISQNVTVMGDPADKPVVKPAGDTGSSGDARGWWLVNAGANLTLRNMVLDGDSPTRKVAQALRANGTITVDNCDFRNVKFATYNGLAVSVFNNGTVSNCTFNNIERIGLIVFGTSANALINGCTYVGKGDGDFLDYGVEIGGGGVATITNNVITDCRGVASSDGSASGGVLATDYYGPGTSATILGNVLTDNTYGIAVGYGTADLSIVAAHYNDVSGCTEGIGNSSSTNPVDAAKNWWGTTDLGAIATLISGSISVDPPLLTSKIRMAFSGNRLVDLQNDDGGWDWPLDDGNPANVSPRNTVGPIAKGLAQAYRATADPDMLAALQQAGALLLTKTTNFSPSDGYLAAELDSIFGGSTYVDHVTANFYGPLAAGTYDKSGAGTLYDTAGYVNLIRTARSGIYANMAVWDIGMGLVAAAACGADLTAWTAGVEAEVNELDGSNYYDVIGLAGAVYALAVADDWEFDPSAGEHAAASNLADLAAILASYQITESGGFAWNSAYVIPHDFNETIQETAYAVLALREVGGYDSEIAAAAAYMLSVQLPTGGWENFVGSSSGENNEITAEAAWGISAAGNVLELIVAAPSLYVQPTEVITIDMNVRDLLQPVSGCQALIGYNSSHFAPPHAVAVGGGVWDQLIYQMFDDLAGELDAAIGVDVAAAGGVATQADGTVAKITFTAGAEGVTQLVFRADPNLEYATMLSDPNGQAIYPNKLDSQTVVIDGTDPVVDSFDVAPLCTKTTTTLTFTVSDDNAGVDYVDVYVDDVLVASDVTSPYALDMSGYATEACYDVKIRVADKAGNETDSAPASVCVDKTAPAISNIRAEQPAGTSVLCPAVALQGTVDIYVDVTDAGCAALVVPPTVTVDGISPVTYVGVTGDTYHYQVTVLSTTSNGSHTITVDAADDLGNASSDTSAAICVDKNQITGQIELEDFVGTSREVTFVATGGLTSKTWTFDVTGFSGAVASFTLTEVPDGSTHVSAKTAWTLRSKVALGDDGDNQWTADLTGADKLLGGDLNGSNYINIQDYSILASNYSLAAPVADIDGSGVVNLTDYAILQANYFKVGDDE